MMKIAAVICEYNPFHQGHVYHIEATKRATKCDYVLGLMSGNFVQRGEPAVLDKWARTEMALRSGLDAVIELPTVYALSSAQYFARGGVSLAAGLGVDDLSFGAESSLETIQNLAEQRGEAYEARLRAGLDAGLSYPKAATEAYLTLSGGIQLKPNDLLAVEYICALGKMSSDIRPVAIPRVHTAHDGTFTQNGFASAHYIRQHTQEAHNYMPAASAAVWHQWLTREGLVTAADFDTLILAKIRTLGAEALDAYAFAGGGLGHLVYKAASNESTVAGVVTACTSAHYTESRIKRLLFQVLLDIQTPLCQAETPYARLLGFRKQSAAILGELERRSRIPVIKSVATFRDHMEQYSNILQAIFRTDLRAQDVYSLALRSADRRKGGRDFTTPMVIL